ncbi:MAG TPA: hypothetical protein DCL39_05140 [Alteromonas macleodii]|mgnify:FL=1|nr:hypothetical protein [Alteromonas macleodii]
MTSLVLLSRCPRVKISFFVPGRPIAKQSFRVGRFGGYQPKRVTDFKKLASLIANEAAKKQGWVKHDGPLHLELMFRFRCPKSARKADKAVERWNTKRPDLDNIEKSITDGLDGLMNDDSQICSKSSIKTIAPFGETEGTYVTVHTLGEYNERTKELVGESVRPDGQQGPD